MINIYALCSSLFKNKTEFELWLKTKIEKPIEEAKRDEGRGPEFCSDVKAKLKRRAKRVSRKGRKAG